MAYNKTNWLDKLVQFPNRYKDQNGNVLELTRDEGVVTQTGTKINASVMNNIESGIETVDQRTETVLAGSTNTGLGQGTFNSNISGISNVAVGVDALFNNNASENTAVGYNAMFSNTTGTGNVALGSNALRNNTTGTGNVALGIDSLKNNTTPNGIVALGRFAMRDNTTGVANTAIGSAALRENITGNDNIAIGVSVLSLNNSASANTVVGNYSMLNHKTGTNNTTLGFQAMENNTSNSGCVAIGFRALRAGGRSNSSCLGNNTAVTGDNQVQLGNSSTTTYVYGTVQNRSDKRDKADIRETALGLDFIKQLKPVDYKWDMREYYITEYPDLEDFKIEETIDGEVVETYDEKAHEEAVKNWKKENDFSAIKRDGSKKRERYHHGFIAQDLKEVLEANGIDFGGYQDHKLKGGEDVQSIGYDEFIAPLVKAIQELSTRVEELEKER